MHNVASLAVNSPGGPESSAPSQEGRVRSHHPSLGIASLVDISPGESSAPFQDEGNASLDAAAASLVDATSGGTSESPEPPQQVPQEGTLLWLASQADNSYVAELSPDPESASRSPNKTSREVFSGHYVPVRPTPLPSPRLVIASLEMLRSLGLTQAEASTDRFVRFFSGDATAAPRAPEESGPGSRRGGFASWATPYALSIYGQEITSNCPFGTDNGYGDGRAVSVGEVVVGGERWELQLKGGGTTPWCRGGDGRAVLRSSGRRTTLARGTTRPRRHGWRRRCLAARPARSPPGRPAPFCAWVTSSSSRGGRGGGGARAPGRRGSCSWPSWRGTRCGGSTGGSPAARAGARARPGSSWRGGWWPC